MMLLKLKYIINNNLKYKLCSTGISDKNVYSSTVLLPFTKMPLRANKLRVEDTELNNDIYKWQRNTFSYQHEFTLHDGPPYANGAPHMGHAINKILKDSILRTQLLQGRKINYIPGWDCHGLPIELKAMKKANMKVEPLKIRQTARNFAMQTIETQRKTFQSWGVLGKWDDPYKTCTKLYIKNQLQQFYRLFEKKLIYRDVKPVYWSPSSRTALAEAELEYNPNHTSLALTVKLKVVKLPIELQSYKNVHILVWTTTPWTLPGNQAVCYNNELNYSLIKQKTNDEIYIIATDLVESHSKMLQTEFEIVHSFNGELLKDITYMHPIYSSELPLLHSSHATASKGTGLVHTAPAHGPDDFLVALQHNIKIKCLVDEKGTYIEETGKDLAGLNVLDSGTQKVIDLLGTSVIHKENFTHSYPYDWRTKKPVILRASQQWFIDMQPIKQPAIDCIAKIDIIPKASADKYRKNLIDQITRRPYWCISRQRSWGVPIPVFYDNRTGNPVINKEIIDHFCTLVEKVGGDFWWKLSSEDLLPETLQTKLEILRENLTKGEDILDIWFDSGISWSSVLPEPQIADMYLEGVDQFTGWFQSSLITSVALRNCAPYKALYVHGFALDEKGLKMSKSVGNVVDPQEIILGSKQKKPLGVNTLRWWVACHANQDTACHVSDNVLKASADEVQKVRSCLRFALGCIGDYTGSEPSYSELELIDKYMLHKLQTYNNQATEYLNEYQFNKICSMILNLITNEISALYYTAIKDRLYCDEASSTSRLGAQFVLHQLINLLTRSIAPIVPHLVEEVFEHLPQCLKPSDCNSFFMRTTYPQGKNEWISAEIELLMNMLLNVRKEINKMTSNAAAGLESHIEISMRNEDINLIKKFGNVRELCTIFQVAEVVLLANDELKSKFAINISKSTQFRCPRCRRITALLPDTLCDRCFVVIDGLKCKELLNN